MNLDLDGIIGRFRAAGPVQHDLSKPRCLLCDAPAVAGNAFTSIETITHDCDCVVDRPGEYFQAQRTILKRMNAAPYFISTLPALYQEYTMDNLPRTPENATARAALNQSLEGNLYLYGPGGTGKTHLAVAAARKAAKGGKSARFWSMVSLLKILRECANPRSEVKRPELLHWDVLVLDDIDKLKATPYAYEVIYELVETRWSNKKTTYFTAQHDPDGAALILTPDQNEVAADPLASRMAAGGRVFRIEGEDSRAR